MMTRVDHDLAFMLRYENVAWYEDGKVRILDRRIYPIRTEFVICTRHEEVAQAIADMVTQSAGPYTAAAMGMALAAYEVVKKGEKDILGYMEKAAYTLSHARPTTVSKMMKVVGGSLEVVKEEVGKGNTGNGLVDALFQYAFQHINNNYKRFMKIGANLVKHIPQGGTIMTQCFAETVLGTTLRMCNENNNPIKIICTETRPYFQGARLTASVARDMGFDVTVICDNMPSYTMKAKKVDLFTSAADVITLDGHIINKVGTFQMALAANYHGVPYFVTGSPNPNHENPSSIKIEEQNPELVLEAMGQKVTMEGVKGYYPVFDITPPKLCDGIVTDKGIYAPMDVRHYFDN